jgi:hypothetical protein
MNVCIKSGQLEDPRYHDILNTFELEIYEHYAYKVSQRDAKKEY